MPYAERTFLCCPAARLNTTEVLVHTPDLMCLRPLQVTSAGAGGRPGLLLADVRTLGSIVEWRNVLLTDQPSHIWPRSGLGRQGGQAHGRLQDYCQHVPVPGSACSPARLAQPDAYQCKPEPGCGEGAPARNATCSGLVCLCTEDTPALPTSSPQLGSPRPLLKWLSWPPSAHPLCQLAPAGVAEVTSISSVAGSLGLIWPALLHSSQERVSVSAAALSRTWTGYKASARVVLQGPTRFVIDFNDQLVWQQPTTSFAMMQVGGRVRVGLWLRVWVRKGSTRVLWIPCGGYMLFVFVHMWAASYRSAGTDVR